jgi:succinate-acetate transporter protein
MQDKFSNPAPLGLTAIYVAIAEVLNEVHGRVILPIGPVLVRAEG